MTLRLLSLTLAGSLVVGGVTRAQAQVAAGLNEVNTALSIFSSRTTGTSVGTDTQTTGVFSGTYGRFLTDHVEVGAQLTAFKSEGADVNGTMGAVAAYHFGAKSNSMVPFAGGQVGRGYGSALDLFNTRLNNPWTYGAFGGIKAFVHGGGGALTVQPFWTHEMRSYEGSGLNDHVHVNTFGITTGVSIFLR